MSAAPDSPQFPGLVDLALSTYGGRALACSDDFFAGMDCLLRPGAANFDPATYTDRGKEMDGWESRRKRVPGHDWCIVELGVPGTVRALDIDTSWFLGNAPSFASVEALRLDPGAAASPDSLAQRSDWVEILPQSALRPGSHNLFAVERPLTATHLRLHIHPDGGVARLRCFGSPLVGEITGQGGEFDLAALVNGGQALACSDMFFGNMTNLILPGEPENMGQGWETKRRRGPGHDWAILKLGARGTLRRVEVGTRHFKGNYPDRCTVDGLDDPGARPWDLVTRLDWIPVVAESKLRADSQANFEDLLRRGPFTHLRLCVFPDGGVSRLRAWGVAELPPGAPR